MVCRYKLNINGLVYQFGNECIKNWDEISYALKRKDHGGTMGSFSSSFQFVGEAYDKLMKEFIASYLNSNATITIYTIEDDLSFRKLYTARLDFGTMKISNGVLSINSFDDSISSLLKAKGSTQYEFLVSEIKEASQLFYDRMLMKSETHWTDGGSLDENDTSISYIELPVPEVRGSMVFPLSIKSSEISVKNKIVVNDTLDYEYHSHEGEGIYTPLVKALDDITITLSFSFRAKVDLPKTREHSVRLSVKGPGRLTRAEWTLDTNFQEIRYSKTFDMKKGSVFLFTLENSSTDINKITITDWADLVVKFDAIDKPEMVDVINPTKLLNTLLSRMSEGRLTGEIMAPDNSQLSKTLILAAESIRGIEGAKIYTTYKKFCDWAETIFGVVPVIDGTIIRLVHRDTLFTDKEPVNAGSLLEDVTMSVDNKMIYSGLKAGYEKKDYDSVNGRDEFRWTNEYETGVNIKESVLSLISPYRADAYGIEFLAARRGEDTSDTSSDTDVFFVNANLVGGEYILDRSMEIEGVISPSTMFNVAFSPRAIIKANERYIASSIDRLVFASSEGNSDIIIAGQDEKADYIVHNPLFRAMVLSFKSAGFIPCTEDNLIKVCHGGRTYEGYIDERTCKYGRYDGVEYKLLVKSII